MVSSICRDSSIKISDVDQVHRIVLPYQAVCIVSGSIDFFSKVRPLVAGYSLVIWLFEQPFRGCSYPKMRRNIRSAAAVLHNWGCETVVFPHSRYGGATNALHLVGFTPAVNGSWSGFTHPPNVVRSLRHFWEPAARVRVEVCRSVPPVSPSEVHRVLTFKQSVRSEGLLNVSSTNISVIGPSVFKPGELIRRRLTPSELRRVFDIPMFVDSALDETNCCPDTPVPYESAVSPTVLTSIFRHVWGFIGGFNESEREIERFNESEREIEPVGGFNESEREIEPVFSSVSDYPDAVADLLASGATSDHPLLSTNLEDDDSISSPGPHPRVIFENFDDASTGSVTASDAETLPDLIGRANSTVCSWDLGSDDDSLLPCQPGKAKLEKQLLTDWDGVDDESTCCLLATGGRSTEDTASLTSAGNESFASLATLYSQDSWSDASDSISQASAATLITSAREAKPTLASRETLEAITKATIGLKAVKADDAEVPVYLWNMRIVGEDPEEKKLTALAGFRKFGLCLFWRGLLKDCMARLKDKFGVGWNLMSLRTESGRLSRVGKEKEAMRHLLWHATEASWFEYNRGSKVYHFRFPLRYQKMARDGVPVFFEKPGPSVMQPQPVFNDPDVLARVKPKIEKVIKRRYMARVSSGLKLRSLIKYFAVPKGIDDIRIVYDGTASGLNEAVWAPSFWLPTIDSLVRALDSESWMADRDIGDMFLNFQLHESVWPFAGVDVAPILGENGRISEDRWYFWVRNAMGFKSSPYNSIKMALVAEEVITGDRFDPANPFQWEKVELNIPGTSTYDPAKTWICKVRKDGLSACVLFTFVDDERIVGATREIAWQASSRLAKIQSYLLGIQDAARKVGCCLQQPRAWSGAVVHVFPEDGVYVLTSEEKWKRLKEIVDKWLTELELGSVELSHKELLSDRGFLVYVTRAYPVMIPYVKGFHLTAEMWRGNRDEDGWKLPPVRMAESGISGDMDDEDDAVAALSVKKKLVADIPRAPASGKTPPAPRLRDDLLALKELTRSEAPPLRLARPKKIVHVFYGFGDASGKGKGATFQGFRTIHHPSGKPGVATGLRYRVGVWSSDEEDESSNYREFANLVESLEEEAEAGRLTDTEVYLFTDNSTTESAYYKGSSSSKKLHGLILKLHKLQMEFQVIVHLIHVSGKRMIAQGTDGCSRGVLMEGVMAGQDMLSFVDLAKTAIERSPNLLAWIRSWTMQDELEPLTPEQWFVEGHGITGGYHDSHGVWMPTHECSGNIHLWAPQPAVADAMLEELLKARHKRTDTYHVIVVPRLMSPRWRRLFHKVSDLHFVVPAGSDYWPSDMFEPLWIGIVLPFVPYRPWQLKRAPLLVELAGKLCQVCKDSDVSARNILRKLLKLPRRLAKLSPGVASGVLHMPREWDLSSGYSTR